MTDLERALAAGGKDITDSTPEEGGPESFLSPETFKPSSGQRPLSNTGPIEQVRRDLSPQPSFLERVKRGIMAGPEPGQATMSNAMDVSGIGPSVDEGIEFTRKHGRPMDPMEADPMAQSAALAALLGPLGRTVYGVLAPRIGALPAGAGIGSIEGALGAASSGGDVGTGAKFGGLFGAAGAMGGKPSQTAVARNNEQVVKDINKGATKATAKQTGDVKFRSDDLGEVMSELPETREALVTKARTNPKASGDAVTVEVGNLTKQNDAVFDAIQAQHGGVDFDGIANRLHRLEGQFNKQGRGVAADAVARVREDWTKRYGSEFGSKLTAEQIRNIRNDLGDIAFPGGGKRPKGARRAEGAIYDELNAAIEEVAAATEGVDVDAFRARNRQISTLLPVQKALGSRASSAADRELSTWQKVKEGAGNTRTRMNRSLRFGAELHGGDNTGLMLSPTAAQFLLRGPQQ